MTATLAALMAVVALSAPSFAKSGGNGGGKGNTATGSATEFWINQSSPHYGDSVTFHAVYPATNQTMVVGLQCWQNNQLTFQLVQAPDSSFQLGGAHVSSDWTGGAAHCSASLMYYTYRGQILTGSVSIADTSFDVLA